MSDLKGEENLTQKSLSRISHVFHWPDLGHAASPGYSLFGEREAKEKEAGNECWVHNKQCLLCVTLVAMVVVLGERRIR